MTAEMAGSIICAILGWTFLVFGLVRIFSLFAEKQQRGVMFVIAAALLLLVSQGYSG